MIDSTRDKRRKNKPRSPFLMTLTGLPAAAMVVAIACGNNPTPGGAPGANGGKDGGNGGVGGGPCSPTGAVKTCHQNLGMAGGYQQCFEGTETCIDGVWSACGGTGQVQGTAVTTAPERMGGLVRSPRPPASSPSGTGSKTGMATTAGSLHPLGNMPAVMPGPSNLACVTCMPKTCAQLGDVCGDIDDGCGGMLTCNTCGPGVSCIDSLCQCIPQVCTPGQNADCGIRDDGCGNKLDCGSCVQDTCGIPLPNVCGGGAGAPCTAKTQAVACAAAQCGWVTDGCGGGFDCGTAPTSLTCTAGQTCGAIGMPNVCVSTACTPLNNPPVTNAQVCAMQGVACGIIGDGCSGAIDCGTCPGGALCISGVCSCTPTTCAAVGVTCGHIDDGCGNDLNCDVMAGGCTGPQVCNQGVCGPAAPACNPLMFCNGIGNPQCACNDNQCGMVSDGCDGVVDCGGCGGGGSCGSNGTVNSNPGTICSGDPCDPYCQELPVDAGVIMGEAGSSSSIGTVGFGQIPSSSLAELNHDQCETGMPCESYSAMTSGGCMPNTCAALGAQCGQPGDGCGGALLCGNNGACNGGKACGVGGFDKCNPPPGCAPKSCGMLGVTCGHTDDGCGNDLTCGNCGGGQVCVAGVCQAGGCTSTTCAAAGATCGFIDDGCGAALNCGTCTATGALCLGNTCSCTPTTCAAAGASCGTIDDGCGNQINCGACTTPGALCQANACSCSAPSPATACTMAGATCGFLDDGCGNAIDCDAVTGGCTGGKHCRANHCHNGGCGILSHNQACTMHGIQCGEVTDGCDGTLQCGLCGAGTECIAGHCAAESCTVKTMGQACGGSGVNCGAVSDGCSGQINCGTCAPGQECKAGNCVVESCTMQTCAGAGAACGGIGDGCGGQLNCGTCPPTDECIAGACVAATMCTPMTMAQACTTPGNLCGKVSDGCSGTIDCGSCTDGNKCALNAGKLTCSCAPSTCAAQGITCGQADDGCGNVLDCGPCGAPQTCGGAGTRGQCGNPTFAAGGQAFYACQMDTYCQPKALGGDGCCHQWGSNAAGMQQWPLAPTGIWEGAESQQPPDVAPSVAGGSNGDVDLTIGPGCSLTEGACASPNECYHLFPICNRGNETLTPAMSTNAGLIAVGVYPADTVVPPGPTSPGPCYPSDPAPLCHVPIPVAGLLPGACFLMDMAGDYTVAGVLTPICPGGEPNSENIMIVNADYAITEGNLTPVAALAGQASPQPGCADNWTDHWGGAGGNSNNPPACGTQTGGYAPVVIQSQYISSCPTSTHVHWGLLTYSSTIQTHGGTSAQVLFQMATAPLLPGMIVGTFSPQVTVASAEAGPPFAADPPVCQLAGPSSDPKCSTGLVGPNPPCCPKNIATAFEASTTPVPPIPAGLGPAAGLVADTNEVLQVTITLNPSLDTLGSAALDSWNISYDCVPSE